MNINTSNCIEFCWCSIIVGQITIGRPAHTTNVLCVCALKSLVWRVLTSQYTKSWVLFLPVPLSTFNSCEVNIVNINIPLRVIWLNLVVLIHGYYLVTKIRRGISISANIKNNGIRISYWRPIPKLCCRYNVFGVRSHSIGNL